MVFENNKGEFDVIMGTNFLSKAGIKNCSEGKMECFDFSIPLPPPGSLDSNDFDAMEDMFFIQDELFGKDLLDCYAT